VEAETPREVARLEDVHRVGRHRGRRWDGRQGPTVGPAESERAIGLAIDLVALLVDHAVVPATEQGEIRERGGAALSPVAKMMALGEAATAARKAAAAIPVVERSPQRRGNRPRAGADLH